MNRTSLDNLKAAFRANPSNQFVKNSNFSRRLDFWNSTREHQIGFLGQKNGSQCIKKLDFHGHRKFDRHEAQHEKQRILMMDHLS